MAITTKFLEDLGISKEIATQIFAERGKEMAESTAKQTELENELATAKKNLETLTAEAETLRTANADGNEWKTKFEKLQNDIAEEKKQAEAERILKEKTESIKTRFAKANEGKGEWYNDFTEKGYLEMFSKALEDEEYSGMSDVDILHELSKNDQNARKGITVVKLAGGTSATHTNEKITKEDFAKMSYRERLEVFDKNPTLYNELRE